MLSKPDYILRARINEPAIRYLWDEWNVQDAYQPADPDLLARLKGLSHRSIVALTIGSAEWVVFRFEGLTDVPEPLEYLEAAWAANVDLAYSFDFSTEDDEWRGPVLGPLNIAMAIVIDALYREHQHGNPAESPCWMSKLAQRVLPNSSQFISWRDRCIDRLLEFFPAPAEDENDLFGDRDMGGDLVPREVLDPDFVFRQEMTKPLINRFLAGLDYESNAFLCTSEEMIEAGFQGRPYCV